MTDPGTPQWKKFWFEWLKPLMVVLLVTGTFRSAVADWNDVPTGSMKPTILEGDRIFINKLAYDLRVPFTLYRIARWDDPMRGDIVILYSPYDGKRLVKRAVGLPGDSVEVRNNVLYVNDAPVRYAAADPKAVQSIPARDQSSFRFYDEELGERPHAVMFTPRKPSMRNFGPVTVPPHSYFVMGDNRDDSFDSRMFGFVNRDSIVGRATSVVASLNPEKHYVPRWSRFFSHLR